MNRREFLNLSAITIAGMGLLPNRVLSEKRNMIQGKNLEYEPIPARWRIHENGSFDLISDEITLKNCYPAMDGQTVHPISINVTMTDIGGKISYQLSTGRLILNLGRDSDSLVMGARLEEFAVAPHWIHPLAHAGIAGADRWFKQGLGFSGPSGVMQLRQPLKRMESTFIGHIEDAWTYDSYLLTAFLTNDDQTLVCAAYDHRNYLQRTTVFNRQYRFGLIDRHLDSNTVFCEAGFATEKINLNQNSLELPDLHFITGKKPFETLRHMAKNIAHVAHVRLDKKSRFHFCSWYEKLEKYSQQDLEELLAGLELIEPEIPLQNIQIDNSYCVLGDWLDSNDNWPAGLENAFKMIRDAGYEPGVWVGPFMVNTRSKLYRDHPDWLLRRADGSIFVEWERDARDKGSVCILDSSHPDAFDYLRIVFRRFREWGVTYFKTDFMDWGLQDSRKVKRHRPGKTSVQYFMDVVKMIREEIGDDSFWLGCISPYPPMIGYVDAMRVSNDVGNSWSEGSTGNMLQETFYCQYFNNVLWQNDPDVLYLRHYDTELNDDETRSIALWDGFLGGVVNTSDRFHTLREDRLKLWRFLQPTENLQTARFPFWSKQDKPLIAVRFYPALKSKAILILNNSDEMLDFDCSLNELIGEQQADCFEWNLGEDAALGKISSLKKKLRPHESVLYYINQHNQPPPPDMSINGVRVKGLREN